jgi:hypothetical protein
VGQRALRVPPVSPHWQYENEPETREALDLIFSDQFGRDEPGVFAPWRDRLLTRGDHDVHLADLKFYLEADRRPGELLADRERWARRGDLERGRFRDVLQRPHHHLGRALSQSHCERGIPPGSMQRAPRPCSQRADTRTLLDASFSVAQRLAEWRSRVQLHRLNFSANCEHSRIFPRALHPEAP